MKIKYSLLVAIVTILAFNSVNAQIISQYTETETGTTPKAIEVWNNTAGTLDFSTNNLIIQQGTNGAAPANLVTISSGTLASGSCIVIGTSLPAGLQTETSANGGTFTVQAFIFNGDDALVVKYGGVTTDVFGNPGSDPGTSWTGSSVNTANQNIQLKSEISSGDLDGWTDPSLRFETVSATPSTVFTGFGECNNAALPVELTTFSAVTMEFGAKLTWNTATEQNNLGFEVQRSVNGNAFSKIAFVDGHGTTNAPQSYSYVDASASAKASYRLKQIDRDGKFTYSQTVEVNNAGTVSSYTLGQNYPNPFNPATTISYALPVAGQVSMKVYDMLGKEVATLVNGMRPAGENTASFDASKIPSGMYFYTLRSVGFSATKKMLLVK
jgi:hypothetical protein